MDTFGSVGPSGSLSAVMIPRYGFYGAPGKAISLPSDMHLKYVMRTLAHEAVLRLRVAAKGAWRGLRHGKGVFAVTRLYATVIRAHGGVEHLGLVGTKMVTDAGVGFIVDAWQNIVELEIMKFHGVGTGTTAEAVGQTALVTESTTALNPDSTRPTGSLTEGASANIFRTVGTATFDATAAITEWGLFSQAATGGGTMFDRVKFGAGAINVGTGDSIQFTFDCTFSSGG
jgi:hypothetical protein